MSIVFGGYSGFCTLSGFYPDKNAFVDLRGSPLASLEDYLDGSAGYVSVAMDETLHLPYGQPLFIEEVSTHFGRRIEFRYVLNRPPFRHKGFSRIDICTRNATSARSAAVNGKAKVSFGSA